MALVRKLLMILTALSLGLPGIVDAQAQSLLANPGFEVPTTTTTPNGNWFRFSSGPNGTSEDSTAMPRSGTGHVDLTIVGANQFAGLFQTLPAPISPGQTLRFTGWHKSVDNPFNATVEIKIEWIGAPQNRIDLLTLGQNYEQFMHSAVAPAGTTGASVTYAISTFGGGQGDSRVFIDDFSASIAALPGDFDHDNDVDVADYLTLSANLFNDVSGLTPEQANLQGDMTSDLLINGSDLRSFRFAFDDANGVAAFAAMLAAVPEPAGDLLTAVACIGYIFRRRPSR